MYNVIVDYLYYKIIGYDYDVVLLFVCVLCNRSEES